ncbi:NAD-dependent epimerase/dehydratase family protein [Luteimonas sp. A501]
MIVGDGMLARAFSPRYRDDPGVLVFASGVANSAETDERAFERERQLFELSASAHAGKLVYFNSVAAALPGRAPTPYMRHKQAMEQRVLEYPGGIVIRLPQVVGTSANPHTLANFLADRIRSGQRFSIRARTERNLVDVEDVARIAEVMIERAPPPQTLVIAGGHSLPMPALVAIFERVLERTAIHDVEDRGAPLPVDAGEAVAVARQLGIDLGAGYAERVVRKYYGGGPG